MSKITFFLPVIGFVLLAVFLWRGLSQNPSEFPSVLIDKPVPEFELLRLDNNELVGKNALPDEVFLLNVWGSYCLPCLVEHPTFMRLAEDDVIPVVGINYKDIQPAALDWLENNGDPFLFSIMDPQGRLGIDLGVAGAPETFLIDASGVIRYRHVSVVDEAAWRDIFVPLIEEVGGGEPDPWP
ncbi:MAG: DsbE family thiol:disulfide interchange protein [Pseudohongiellaceae bacterium]